MTHAEVRERLRPYADGTLDDADAEVVRIHLATGCADCLRDVFTRPVGVPRVPLVVQQVPRGVFAMAVLAAAALGGSVGLLLGLTGAGASGGPDPTLERLATELERLRVERTQADASAEERIARLEAQLREPDRSPPAAPEAAPATRDTTVGAETVPGWLEGLLSTPGARVVPLHPAGSAPGASGYAVWSPARGIVVVSASDLPAGLRAAVYRVRVSMNDGSTVWLGDVAASEVGTVFVTVAMPDPAGRRVTGVDLYRDPPGTPALTANLRY